MVKKNEPAPKTQKTEDKKKEEDTGTKIKPVRKMRIKLEAEILKEKMRNGTDKELKPLLKAQADGLRRLAKCKTEEELTEQVAKETQRFVTAMESFQSIASNH